MPFLIFLSEVLEEERAEHMVLGSILFFLLLADQIPTRKTTYMSLQNQQTKIDSHFYNFNLR